MNVILACTTVYGVFAPYTAGGNGILDIQRNSSCDPCPSPTLVSLSSPPPIPAWPESGGKRVAETRNRISQARIIHLKMSQANPISSFGNSFSTGFWSGGGLEVEMRGRRGWGTDMDHSWNSAVYPEFRCLQPYKEQKLRKRLYMPISHSSFTV